MNRPEKKSCEEFFVEFNDERFAINTHEELKEITLRAEGMPIGRLWIGQDGGPRPLWQRILGLKNYVDALLVIEWIAIDASLIFYDKNWSEYRVLDKEKPHFSTELTRCQIAQGEQRAIAEDECMSKTRAFIAIHEFIETRQKPTWLFYRFVK